MSNGLERSNPSFFISLSLSFLPFLSLSEMNRILASFSALFIQLSMMFLLFSLKVAGLKSNTERGQELWEGFPCFPCVVSTVPPPHPPFL